MTNRKRKRLRKLAKKKPITEMDVCRHCGKTFTVDKLHYGPCPFAAEVYNDQTPTVLCDKCEHESHMDI